MNLTEQLLSRREIYHGRIIDVQVDTVSLPNGNTSTREVVRHPGGVGILALDDEGCAVLVEQYRIVFAACFHHPEYTGYPCYRTG